MKTYEPAEEVQEIAEQTVIPQWHEHAKGLLFAYLFTDEIGNSKGRVVMAKVKKMGAIEAAVTGLDAVMVVDRTIWNRLTEQQRVALIDHEFCHVGIDEAGAVVLRGHDLEEFIAVVKRHGAWMDDIKRFNEAQMDLFAAGLIAADARVGEIGADAVSGGD